MSRSTSEQVAGVELTDPQLRATLERGLTQVEDLLHREVQSELRFLTKSSLHLVDAGGKRFRPLLTLLAGQFGPVGLDQGGRMADVVRAAAVVELVHLATLYHDDVMDEATIRRGAVSANARWDNTVAILTGDFLFAHASRLVADLGPEAVRIISCTFAELVTGQMRETLGPDEGADPVAHYLAVAAEKTGSLIATAGRYGAMFSGAPQERIDALRRFGEKIGTAFQISDDIIDIVSPATQSGKTPGTDLREGVRTLPMLYALAEPGFDRLRVLLAGPLTDDRLIAEALHLLRGSPGLGRAVQALRSYTDSAHAELAALPPGPARDALTSVTDYLSTRTG
jgi:heptaprenyl diphosphate synthase